MTLNRSRVRQACWPQIVLSISLVLSGCAPKAPVPATQLNPNLIIGFSAKPSAPRELDLTRFTVRLQSAERHPVSDADVTIQLIMPSMAMGKNEVTLKPASPGVYVGAGRFTMSGDWEMVVSADAQNERAVESFPISVR